MAQAAKKVNYYRLALRKGLRTRMELTEDDRLAGKGGGNFCYLAKKFDSEEYDATWHRFRLEGSFTDCKYEVYVAATNTDISDLLYAEGVSDADRITLLLRNGAVRSSGKDDLLLHGITGRYLWILIRVSGAKPVSTFRIEGFSVEFPAESFITYLPEIYQEEGRDSFFERYMAVFQSLYEDMENEIAKIPEMLDVDSASDENLKLFDNWTGGMNEDGDLSAEQERYILHNLQRLQSGKGTERILREIIELVTGQKAVIVEYFKWHDWMKGKSSILEDYEKLFGNNEDMFTVIINDTDGKLEGRKAMIEKLIKDYVPLGMICNIVWLEKSSHMDMHCYLDDNSTLAAPMQATTRGMILGNQIVVG